MLSGSWALTTANVFALNVVQLALSGVYCSMNAAVTGCGTTAELVLPPPQAVSRAMVSAGTAIRNDLCIFKNGLLQS
jgi:hypothetical protein